MKWIIGIALAALVIGISVTFLWWSLSDPEKVLSDEAGSPVTYFLEQWPTEMPLMPVGASDIIVAKVRLREEVDLQFHRHGFIGSFELREEDLPKYAYGARLQITEVRSGNAAVGDSLDVQFAPRGRKLYRADMYPYTPDQREREYFVVIFNNLDDNVRRLAAFSISRSEFDRWNTLRAKEQMQYIK